MTIDHLWDGEPAGAQERVHLELTETQDSLTVRIDAPFHGDPAPATPLGRCEGLWRFEVVEVFLVGPDERYLELEFGPAGHYLGLEFHGVRRVVDAHVPLDYSATRDAGRWNGVATIARGRLPSPIVRWNAFAIHGGAQQRRYLVAAPLPVGEEPDFHQIDRFPAYGSSGTQDANTPRPFPSSAS